MRPTALRSLIPALAALLLPFAAHAQQQGVAVRGDVDGDGRVTWAAARSAS